MAVKTFRADQDVVRLTPTSLPALQLASVSGREVARAFEVLLASGLQEGSVVRYRASLSVFFAWLCSGEAHRDESRHWREGSEAECRTD